MNKARAAMRAERLAAKVAAWNERTPIGAAVTYRRYEGSLTETRTRSAASVLSGHTAVIWLDGISGCVDLDRVSPR